MYIRKQTKFLSIILVISLLLSSFNLSVFASTSQVANTEEISTIERNLNIHKKRIVNLEVFDTLTNEVHKTSMLFLPGSEWDKNTIEGLDSRYLLTNYEYYYLSAKETTPQVTVDNDGLISLLFVDTIFDVGNFSMSLVEYAIEPTFWNGFWVVADGLAMVFPGIPSLSGVKRMIKASSTLETALEIGVMKYSALKNVSIPTGWARHHIFEKRFVPALSGATESNMLAIPISGANHTLITNKMRSKVPYGTNYSNMTSTTVMNHHINAYKELWDETDDEYWEFLYNLAQTKQYK